jgi:hypothetical protein
MQHTDVQKPAGAGTTKSGTLQILERLLRDREALFEEIVDGKQLGDVIKAFVTVSLVLLGIYGFSMGFYNSLAQASFAAIKVPLLFFLTLIACFPILYVFNILFGSRLGFLSTLSLILASITTMSVILGAFAPITFLFVVSQSSYSFMKLLHVIVMGTAATVGLVCLYRALVVVCEKSNIYPKSAIHILKVWLLIFAFVGTQTTWALRPFLADKARPLEVLREDRTGNFYQAVILAAKDLIDD